MRDRDRPGWEKIRFKCFHGRPGLWRGEPAALDALEALARINPCKLTNCPDRVRPKEET